MRLTGRDAEEDGKDQSRDFGNVVAVVEVFDLAGEKVDGAFDGVEGGVGRVGWRRDGHEQG